jgi:hypothetical protein
MTIDRKNGKRRSPPWSNPSPEPARGDLVTRRRFVGGVLAAAGAAVTAKAVAPAPPSEPPRWTGRTRWIGHC